MALKQWRAVYEYKKDLIRGAGACFAFGRDEAEARAAIELAMPGVTITQIREEPTDPRAQYERRPEPAEFARTGDASTLEQRIEKIAPSCEACGELLVGEAERTRGWCDNCEKQRHVDMADARGHV